VDRSHDLVVGDAETAVDVRAKRAPCAPWLVATSLDGYRWVVASGAGAKEETEEFTFDIELPDGTKLSSPGNEELFEMAVAYAETVRLFMPDIGSEVHRQRVVHLLTFFYWLRLHKVKSLTRVTADHIAQYQETAALGREWITQSPQRLVRYLRGVIESGDKLPLAERYRPKLASGKIYEPAGLTGISDRGSLCRAVLDYVEKSTELKSLPTLEEILLTQETAPRVLTYQHVHRILLPIEELWVWRDQLPSANLPHRPFRQGAMKAAIRLGIDPKRTPNIPPHVAFRYLAGAMRWVVDYAPIILSGVERGTELFELQRQLREAGLPVDIMDSHGQIYRRMGKISPEGLVKVTGAACFALIASLSARRDDEINDLGAGCCTKDDDGNAWLVIYIEKTLQRYDQVPVPDAVRLAIDCLERISCGAREFTKSDSLWQWFNPGSSRVKKLRPEAYLNVLAEFNEVFTGTEERWRFAPHQFRRFFALLYFWRFEKADLAALSHHLRHFDLEMTRRYVIDVEFNRMWKETETEWREHFLREVVEGSRSVGGKAGERLKREAAKLLALYRRKVEVVAPERVVSRLSQLAERWGAEFRQFIWGTICACPKNTALAAHAKCKGGNHVGPNYANARDEFCAQCPFAIRTQAFQTHLPSRIDSNKAIIAGTRAGTIVAELAVENITTLESILISGNPAPTPIE